MTKEIEKDVRAIEKEETHIRQLEKNVKDAEECLHIREIDTVMRRKMPQTAKIILTLLAKTNIIFYYHKEKMPQIEKLFRACYENPERLLRSFRNGHK